MAQKTRKIRIIKQCLHEGESLFVGSVHTLPAEEAGYLVFIKKAVFADGDDVDRDAKGQDRDPKRSPVTR